LVVAMAILLPASLTHGTATASERPSAPPTADATIVSRWNELAVTTLAGDTTKAQPGNIFLMGMFHAAIYDAVVGVEGRYEPYKYRTKAPRGASSPAAAVAAAHRMLVTYAPYAQVALDAARAESLAQIPDGAGKTKGVDHGTRVADNLIALRADDGRNAPIQFTQAPAPGVWRPTPTAFAPMSDPWLGFVKPLLVRSPTQFGPTAPPPALTSAQYTRDFVEVKALGSKTSTARTAEQTSTALFFSGSVIGQWNAALRDQATVRHLDIVDGARLFAAIDMSMADIFMTVWYAKHVFGYWRPVTAINLADTDGNPETVADPTWEPLLATPPYPDYTSGYNAATGTVSGGLEKLFGPEHLNLTLISTAVPDVRHYDSGPALRDDVVNARILLGIHFRTADEQSRDMALRLVNWTLDRNFRPVRY
jgi:hypothetical protein